MAEHRAQPDAEILRRLPHARRCELRRRVGVTRRALALRRTNPAEHPCRPQVARGIDHDRDRCTERGDQDARTRGSTDLGDRLGGLELRVALGEMLGGNDRRQVRDVGDLEHRARGADQRADHEHVHDRQHARCPRDRQRCDERRAQQIRGDEDPPLAPAIDEATREQRQDRARRELERRQQPDDALGFAERHDRDDR